MRILEGVSTVIQLGGLMARLCQMVSNLFLSMSFSNNLPWTLQRLDPKLFQVKA